MSDVVGLIDDLKDIPPQDEIDALEDIEKMIENVDEIKDNATELKDNSADGIVDDDSTQKKKEIEQSVFEECEKTFLPLMDRWKKVLTGNPTENCKEEMEQIYTELLKNIEEFTAPFIKEYKMDNLLNESKRVLDNKARKDVQVKLKKCFTEKSKRIPDGFKAVSIYSAKRKPEIVKENRKRQKKDTEKGTTTKEKQMTKKQTASKEDKACTKKLRVKPERVLEVKGMLVGELVKNYERGVHEMDMTLLASQVGFKNPRSDALADAVKLLRSEGTVEKPNKDTCKLTEKGIKDNVKEVTLPDNPEAIIDMYKDHFLDALANTAKGKGGKARSAAERVWDLLLDGEAHDMQEVLQVAKYAGENSSGMEEIKRQLKKLNLAGKKDKKLQFMEKVLKHLK